MKKTITAKKTMMNTVAACVLAVTVFLLVAAPALAEPEAAVPTEPQNGIPLLILNIDESEAGIAAAAEDDKDHAYGTIADMNESEDHSTRCIGNAQVLVPDGYTSEYGSSSAPAGSLELKYIRGRGQSTWGLSLKKPYRLEFADEQDFFGMGESTAWALMANSFDDSLLRNRVTYWLGDHVGLPYSPQQVPVDVVMIGSESGATFLGSYTLCETVRVQKGRVDIPRLGKDAVDDEEITGGYLLSVYNDVQSADEPESNYFALESGLRFVNETPDFESEDLTEGQAKQRTYIRDFMQEVDSLIMAPETIDEAAHNAIAEKMDLESTADYWWIQEFSGNTDAFTTPSTYLCKTADAASEPGKLYWGPLWDFDLAYKVGEDTELGAREGFIGPSFAWLDKLRESDPLFVELLKERWQDPKTGMNVKLEELTKEGGVLDQYRDEIKASWQADFDKWGEVQADSPDESTAPDSIDARIEALRTWIDARRSWVNDNLDLLDKVHCTITYLVDGEEYATETARLGEFLPYPPDAPEREGLVFIGWQEEQTGEDRLGYKPTEDTVFVAQYVDENEVVLPTALYFKRYECWASMGTDHYYLNPLKGYPEDVIPAMVKWSSSDESVAIVEFDGFPKLVGVGEATITATHSNGVSNSYVLHVYDADELEQKEPEGVTLAPTAMTLKRGQADQVQVALTPEGPLGFVNVVIESSDPAVASVDEAGYGIVTGLAPGAATITAKGIDFDDKVLFEASCEVTVSDEEYVPGEEVPGLGGDTQDIAPWAIGLFAVGVGIGVIMAAWKRRQ